MLDHLTWRLVFFTGILSYVSCDLQFNPVSVQFGIGECKSINLSTNTRYRGNSTIHLQTDHNDIVLINPPEIHVGNDDNWIVVICGSGPGFTVISATVDDPSTNDEAFLHVTVGKSYALELLGTIVGWIYFAAWSISFYPQMYENYTRKSVVGLSFDFISLNVVGFTLYSVYNCALYYLPSMQNEYFERYPKGLNPVQFNDVFFSTHAVFASSIVAIQCIIYERGGQCVSMVAKIILLVYFCIVTASGTCAFISIIHWLDFLNYCSYIKLSVTLIKYIPQAVLNYSRKSTQGWCISNVLLDFTGGTLSLAQMLLNGYNYNDWDSIFGDLTKFGLGVFTIAFDLIFIYQHYVLYRYTEYEEPIIDDSIQNAESPPPVSDPNFSSDPNA